MFIFLVVILCSVYVALDALHFRVRKRSPALRVPLGAIQIPSGFLGFWYLRPMLQAYMATHKLFALCLIAVTALLVLRARGYTPAAKAWLALRWLLILALLISGAWFVSFYITRDRCAMVLADPRVKPIFTTCDPKLEKELRTRFPQHEWGKIMRELQPRSVFLSAVPGRVYIGTGNEEEKEPEQILALVERNTGRVLRVERTPAVFRGYCDAETSLCAASISATEQLLIFNDINGGVVKTIKMPARPRFMLAPPGRRILYVGADRDPIVSVFNLDKLKITNFGYSTAAYRGVWSPCMMIEYESQGMTFMAFNSKTRELNLTPECPVFNTVLVRTDENLTKIRHINIGWRRHLFSMGCITGIEIDTALNEIYLSAALDGSVFICDYDTLKVKKKIHLGVGLRETTYDPDRHLLFVGHYVDGNLYVIDMPHRKIIDRIFIGKRSRQILYDPSTKSVLVTSANGFFDVDVSNY